MSTLFLAQFADRAPATVAEADAEEVNTTVTTVNRDDAPAMAPAPPDYNALLVDRDTDGGLTTTQLASYVRPSKQGAPVADTSANDGARDDVNRSNSQDGHAAAKEATGEWGHGTLQIVEGIEPAIRDGGSFDGTYFAADNRSNPAGDYMTATRTADGGTQAAGEARADAAVTASQSNNDMYRAFLSAMTGAS